MASFIGSLSSFARRLGSKKTSKRKKRKVIILSDDSKSKRRGKRTTKKTTDPKEVKRQLEYDSDTPLVNLKRRCKKVVKHCPNDDPGPSRGETTDDEEGGETSVEASDDSDAEFSGTGKSDDDESSVKPHKEKPSFFCNRRLRQAAKNKEANKNIASGEVQTKTKKGKEAMPVYDVSSSSPVRMTRSKARALQISSEKPRTKNAKLKKANKRKRAEKSSNDSMEPRKQRKRSKLNEWLGIRTRSSPTQFTRCINILSDKQRLAVKEMGFGRLLSIKMDGIPAKLGHYVVDNFDPDSLELTLPSVTLSIDAEVVHKILGIPIGGVSFNALESRDEHDEGIAKWKKRYPPSRFRSPKQMVDMIEKESNGEDDFNFRMDFIMCFYTIMVDCHKQGSLKDNILDYLTDDLDFAGLDWCELVVEVLRSCKVGWRRDSLDPPFTGPLTFLTLLYVDSFKCKGVDVDSSVVPMSFWTFQRLRDRERIEIKEGGFGRGTLKPLTSYKGVKLGIDEPSIEERVASVGDLVDVLIRTRKRVESAICKLDEDYPGRKEVVAVKARYGEFIKDMGKASEVKAVARC